MIDAILSGRLYGKPQARESRNGNPYATAKVRAAGADGESVFASVIAFDDAAVTALLALDDGDPVALAGELTPQAWIDRDGNARPGLDCKAHAVLSPYAIRRKRKETAGED